MRGKCEVDPPPPPRRVARKLPTVRRVILAIAMCLLLGLLTSIALAWAAAFDPDWSRGDERRGWFGSQWFGSATELRACTYLRLGAVGDAHQRTDRTRTLDLKQFAAPLANFARQRLASPKAQVDAVMSGWPWPCLYYIRAADEVVMFPDWEYEHHGVLLGGNPLPAMFTTSSEVQLLPLRPYWPGVLANTLLLAAVWFVFPLLWSMNRRSRAYIKKRRGRCRFCSYELHGDTQRCPECGRSKTELVAFISRPTNIALSVLSLVLVATVLSCALLFRLADPYPPLHWAAYHGDAQTVSELLDGGADPNAIEMIQSEGMSWSLTPLSAACANRDPEMVQLLLDHGADESLNVGGYYIPFNIAIEAGCLECAEMLLDGGFDIDARANNCSVFFGPAINGDVQAVDFLLGHDGDAHLAGNAVAIAVFRGNCTVLQRLLDSGAPPTHRAIRTAVRKGNARAFEMLLDCGGDLLEQSSNGRTPLFAIGHDSHPENRQMWLRIVDAGVDVNAKDANGRTALIGAAESAQNPAAVFFLLEHGADPNVIDPNGTTALSQAAYWNHLVSVITLLGFGADPEPALQAGFVRVEAHIEQLIIDAWDVWYGDGSTDQPSVNRSLESKE